MKKIVFAGLVAVSLMAIAHQQASAWVNSRLGIGLNWDVQSGGNSFLWGAYRNGQPPGPEAFGGGGGGQRFGAPMPQGHGFAPMQQGYPGQGFAPMPQGYPPQGFAPMPQAPFNASTAEPPFAGQYHSPYQFANYPRPIYYYYPSYYYDR